MLHEENYYYNVFDFHSVRSLYGEIEGWGTERLSCVSIYAGRFDLTSYINKTL